MVIFKLEALKQKSLRGTIFLGDNCKWISILKIPNILRDGLDSIYNHRAKTF